MNPDDNNAGMHPENIASAHEGRLSLLYRFFCWCSGARLYILKKCPTDYNKFFGIGIIIFLTALMAFFSGAYAFFTIFESKVTAIVFGLFWGMVIFFLDWYLVSSMKKEGKPWKELLVGFPRLMLAVLIAVVIAKPLELRIFEKEINQELQAINQEKLTNRQHLINAEFDELNILLDENERMQNELLELQNKRDELFQMVIAEAEGRSPTQKVGKGPVYKEKQIEFRKMEAALKEKKALLLPLLESNHSRILELRSQKRQKTEYVAEVNHNADGFLARLSALSQLSKENYSIALASFFIILLFILIEAAPVLVKLITQRGPYDKLFEAFELQKNNETLQIENFLINSSEDFKLNQQKMELRNELEIKSHELFLKKLFTAKEKIDDQKVSAWEKSQNNDLQTNMKKYIPELEQMLDSNHRTKAKVSKN